MEDEKFLKFCNETNVNWLQWCIIKSIYYNKCTELYDSIWNNYNDILYKLDNSSIKKLYNSVPKLIYDGKENLAPHLDVMFNDIFDNNYSELEKKICKLSLLGQYNLVKELLKEYVNEIK